MQILYKPIRNGYARIDNTGELIISIPNKLEHNEWFKNALLEKWNQLLARYKKKTHILTSDKEWVTLFGERVPIADFYKQHNKTKVPSALSFKPLAAKLLQWILEEYSKPLLDYYSNELGIEYKKLTIRKTKSKRWSCTSDRNISLNLNLVHLPTKFIKYVIIHEACHLKIKNHSKKFRALVETFVPDYKIIRKEMTKFIVR